MKAVITGGAGFIGSHLADRLVENGDEVVIVDNLSTGRNSFITGHIENNDVKFIKCDVLDMKSAKNELEDADIIFHLSAVSDVRIADRMRMFEQNVTATANLLEIMKECNINNIAFFSSQAVYGNVAGVITEETPAQPVSLYGATKLASEHLIATYSRCFAMRSWIFRIANVVGVRQTHGVIVDFVKKLKNDKTSLEILGDGRQEKSYIHVSDCMGAVLHAVSKSKERINLFNIGSGDTITVDEIAGIVALEMGLAPRFAHTGGSIGWPGDIALSRLSIEKLKASGWSPKYSSLQAVKKSVRELLE